MKNIYALSSKVAWTNYDFCQSQEFSTLNNTFFYQLDKNLQQAIRTVRLPYVAKGSNKSFKTGAKTKIFLLSAKEYSCTNTTYGKIGTVLDYKQGKVRIKLTDTLYQHDGLRILNEPVDTGLTAVRIYKNGLLVNKADKGDIVELDCNSKPYPKKGQLLQKTSDSYLISCIDQEINESIRRVDIEAEYEFIENKPKEKGVPKSI